MLPRDIIGKEIIFRIPKIIPVKENTTLVTYINVSVFIYMHTNMYSCVYVNVYIHILRFYIYIYINIIYVYVDMYDEPKFLNTELNFSTGIKFPLL